jgi:hypothetical protein
VAKACSGGQRNRRREPLLRAARNHVAHGSGDHLVTPVDTARDISDAAEIINQLWGSATPGGPLFPAPVRREVQVVAWSTPGGVLTGPVDGGLPVEQYSGWECALVRAVLQDDRLDRFDSLFEMTLYPAELLWGPGSLPDASAWLSRYKDEPDEVEVIDRLFAIRHHQDRLYWPRDLDVTAGLGDDSRDGTWHLIRADYPDDAFAHARGVTWSQCSPDSGPCKQCPADSIGTGSWQEVIDLAARTGTLIVPRRLPDFNVPTLHATPRSFDVHRR